MNQIVNLIEMLDAREIRCQTQQRILLQYKRPLICITLNIPGSIKVFPGIPDAFLLGTQRIEQILSLHLVLILHLETVKEKTGYEGFYSVDASPEYLKELMIKLEDQDRLGRLFDIDVLRLDGTKVSREELGYSPRKCLLCEETAHACSRNRTHGVEELVDRICDLLTSIEIPDGS